MEKELISFNYAGKTFIPIRKLNSNQTFEMTSRFLRTDRELYLSTYVGTYTHESFYNASGESECDLFRCEENGKVYIPCKNELFQYTSKR